MKTDPRVFESPVVDMLTGLYKFLHEEALDPRVPPEYLYRRCGACGDRFPTTYVSGIDVCIECEIWSQREIDRLTPAIPISLHVTNVKKGTWFHVA
jgi:hypothetical protein